MPPRKHAVLGASGAYRWANCPGSVALSEGLPDYDSPYAIEGTAAHALLEQCLRRGVDATDLVGLEVKVDRDGKVTHVPVTEEMTEAVQVVLDYVREETRGGECQVFIEQEIDLAKLNPPGPMYGTSDVVLWCPGDRRLEVIDFKYGAGVAVDVKGNWQTRYYGLGSVLALNQVPERIRLTIIQPRVSHPDGIIRSEDLTFEELREWKHELFERAVATTDPNAPLVVGPWCQFCKALPVCPAQKQTAIEVAQSEFTALTPPPPSTLTHAELGKVLAVKPQLIAWLNAVEEFVLERLIAGEQVPGFKVVEGRQGDRKWKDEEEAAALFEELLGAEALTRPRLKSPAQIEKELRRAKVKMDISELVTRSPGRPRLAPEDDDRPAIAVSAVDEFTAE